LCDVKVCENPTMLIVGSLRVVGVSPLKDSEGLTAAGSLITLTGTLSDLQACHKKLIVGGNLPF